MNPIVSLPISALFCATTLVAIVWLHRAVRNIPFLIGLVLWTAIQGTLGIAGFYQETSVMPPRIMLFGVAPTLLFMAALFLTRHGRHLMDGTNLHTLTWMHTVRIPVEVVLWLLVQRQVLSPTMSVGGTNFDILSGITAPLIGYLAFRTERTDHRLLLWWNITCVLLLFNVVITAALGIPSPVQQHSFDQPNLAVLYFPFNLLPTVVVPLVLLAHLIAFWQLRRRA